MKIPSSSLRVRLLVVAFLSPFCLAGCSKPEAASTASDVQAFQGNPQKIAEAQARAEAQKPKAIQQSQAQNQTGK